MSAGDIVPAGFGRVERHTGARRKSALFLLASLGLVALAVVFVLRFDDIRAWLMLAVVSSFATIFAVTLIRPQRVIMDEAGFTVVGGLVRRPHRVRWGDVDGFFLYDLPRGGAVIGYNHAPSVRVRSPSSDRNRRLASDGVLPPGSIDAPERLVDELNRLRGLALAPTVTAAAGDRLPPTDVR